MQNSNFDFSIQNLEFRKNPIENVSINGSILVIFGEKMMSKKKTLFFEAQYGNSDSYKVFYLLIGNFSMCWNFYLGLQKKVLFFFDNFRN